MKLMSQIMQYKADEAPYNIPFADEFISATLWWQTTEVCMGSELTRTWALLIGFVQNSCLEFYKMVVHETEHI